MPVLGSWQGFPSLSSRRQQPTTSLAAFFIFERITTIFETASLLPF